MTNHGTCDRCGFMIECDDPTGCSRHDFLTHHYEPKDCIKLLKTELHRIRRVMEMNGWTIYSGEF